MAKEFTICPRDGLVVANDEMHAAYHTYVDQVIGRMQAMVDIIWEDAKLDKSKKIDPPPLPPEIDY